MERRCPAGHADADAGRQEPGAGGEGVCRQLPLLRSPCVSRLVMLSSLAKRGGAEASQLTWVPEVCFSL